MLGTQSAAQLADENRYLNDELNRVETVLNLTRAEKDELSIRYNALSDRVSFFNDYVMSGFLAIRPWKKIKRLDFNDSHILKCNLFCSYFRDKIFLLLIV
jgi:hypothetical protein